MQKTENWHDKKQVQKGDYGEMLVRKYLESSGWIVYEPKTEGPHAFDKLCVKDKKHIIISEVKTKARMNKWNATGFNIRSYEEYNLIIDKYGIDIFVFFVDEMLKQIYGNKLTLLRKEYIAADGVYPMKINNIIVFSLECMKTITKLNDNDIDYLINHSSRNYEYEVANGRNTVD